MTPYTGSALPADLYRLSLCCCLFKDSGCAVVDSLFIVVLMLVFLCSFGPCFVMSY